MVKDKLMNTKVVQHRVTKHIKELTQEQYDRFFDNNSPFDWLLIKEEF